MIEASVENAKNTELFTTVEQLQEVMLANADNPICDSEELNSDNSNTAYQNQNKEQASGQYNENRKKNT